MPAQRQSRERRRVLHEHHGDLGLLEQAVGVGAELRDEAAALLVGELRREAGDQVETRFKIAVIGAVQEEANVFEEVEHVGVSPVLPPQARGVVCVFISRFPRPEPTTSVRIRYRYRAATSAAAAAAGGGILRSSAGRSLLHARHKTQVEHIVEMRPPLAGLARSLLDLMVQKTRPGL